MKILLYSHSYAPNVGGVETFSMRLATQLPLALGAPSVNVTVVTQTPAGAEADATESALRVIRRPGTLRLWKLVGESDLILLVGPAFLPLLTGLLRSKPVVVTHHGYQTICPNGLLFHVPSQSCCPGHFRAKRYLECVRCCTKESGFTGSVIRVLLTFPRRALCRLARRNVSVSEHLARRLQLPSSTVIRNGVPVSPPNFERAPAEGRLRFLFVGRMVAEKGINVLIKAARILKDRGQSFQLVLAGDGPERPMLEEFSEHEGLHEELLFLGFKTAQEVQDLLSQPFACITPSVWEETAGLSTLEQMMAGKAVIVSDIGGLSEEVAGAGVTFRTGDAAALADRMQDLLLSPGQAQSLGKAARQRAASKYSAEEMLSHYAELLRSIKLD